MENNLELIEKHVKSTGLCSTMEHMRKISPTYADIISKGKDILPDVLKFLKEKQSGTNVMLLLKDITKITPWKKEQVGIVDEQRKAWIEWGVKEKNI